jgi:hypothetical protein
MEGGDVWCASGGVCAEVAIMILRRHIHMFHESCKPCAVRLFLEHAFFSAKVRKMLECCFDAPSWKVL